MVEVRLKGQARRDNLSKRALGATHIHLLPAGRARKQDGPVTLHDREHVFGIPGGRRIAAERNQVDVCRRVPYCLFVDEELIALLFRLEPGGITGHSKSRKSHGCLVHLALPCRQESVDLDRTVGQIPFVTGKELQLAGLEIVVYVRNVPLQRHRGFRETERGRQHPHAAFLVLQSGTHI